MLRISCLIPFLALLLSQSALYAQVAAPVLSLSSTSSATKFPITVTGPAGSTIYYNSSALENDTPVPPGLGDSSFVTSGSVNISSSQLFQAVAVTASGTSAVTSGTYEVTGGLAMGSAFAMALRFDRNSLLTWGTNANGELGDGTTTSKVMGYTTVKSSGTVLGNVVQISAGGNHGLAVLSNGTLMLWGENGAGQLAQGSMTNSTSAVLGQDLNIAYLTNVKKAGGGSFHSVALLNTGFVFASGTNTAGQLGINDSTAAKKLRFNQVKRDTASGATNLEGVQDIAVGANHTLALRLSGTATSVWTWGKNNVGQLGLANSAIVEKHRAFRVDTLDGMDIRSIGAGWQTGYAIVGVNGTTVPYAWGKNDRKQLSRGSASDAGWTPGVMKADASGAWFTGAVAVCGGNSHTLILREDGTVWACGSNAYNQLGNWSFTADQGYPVPVLKYDGTQLGNVMAIAAGGDSSMAIDRDGWIYTWGLNTSGQLCLDTQYGSMWFAYPSSYAPQITNKPPTVDLVHTFSPSTGNMARADATLTASPVDVDGTPIARVDFYQEGNWVGKAMSSPYALSLTQLGAGAYEFTARASDTLGAEGRESPVHRIDVTTPSVTLQASATPIVEGQTATAFTISRGQTHPDSLAVNLTLDGGTALPSDYSFVGALSPVTIPSGAASVNISIAANDDLYVEPSKTVAVTLASGGSAYGIGTGTLQSVTIDDRPPKLTIALTGTNAIAETSGTATVRISLDRALPLPRTVAYTLGGTAVSGADYAMLTGSAVLPVGSNPFVDLYITAVDDLKAEGDETIVLAVSGTTFIDGTGWVFGTSSSVSLTILDAPLIDSDLDGLFDRWELRHGFNPADDDENNNGEKDGFEDWDGDGLSNQQEYANETDPQDYLSGGTPTLIKEGGDEQLGTRNAMLAQPLVVRVINTPGSDPLPNTPLTFTAQRGAHMSISNDSGAVDLSESLSVLSGTDGRGQVYVKMPDDEGIDVRVSAAVNGVTAEFLSTIHGLAGHWTLNNSPSDSSGHSYDGAISGAGATWGMSMDGAGALVLTGNQALLLSNTTNRLIPGGTKPFSLAFWIKQDVISPNQLNSLMTNETYQVSGFRMGIDAGMYHPGANRLIFWSSESGGTIDLQSQTTIQPGVWYHVAVTYDGITAKCYINGQLEDQDDGLIISNSNDIIVGNGIGGEMGLTGAIDDLRIFYGAISASAVSEIKRTGFDPQVDQDLDDLSDLWEMRAKGSKTGGMEYDTDGDGIPDVSDEAPSDPARGVFRVSIQFPAEGQVIEQ